MGLIGDEVKIFDGNENDQVTIEGPKMYKRNGWYYIFAPAGGVKTGWQTVLRSRHVFGPYEYKVVMRQGDSPVNGPHQGAWVDTVTGEDWFLHFQDVYSAGRIVHLQPMHWEKDWPVIGMAKAGKDYGEPVTEYRKPEVGSVVWEICEPDTSDDFTGDRLGLQWQWNANPKAGWYELTGNALRLYAVPRQRQGTKPCPYGDLPNLLLTKWPAPEFSCVTKLDLSQLVDGDEAGIISMGMKYGLLSIKKQAGRLLAAYVSGQQQFGKILAECTTEMEYAIGELQTDILYVRYQVQRDGTQDLSEKEKGFPRERVTISYSTDGDTYLEAGHMYAVPGRWVGVKSGMFCTRNEEGTGGFLRVESVVFGGTNVIF
jgi:beta-xylosidase